MNRLPPLFPLLVKGRNLYRLRTFRQVTYLFVESPYCQLMSFQEVGLLVCFLCNGFSIGVMNQKD